MYCSAAIHSGDGTNICRLCTIVGTCKPVRKQHERSIVQRGKFGRWGQGRSHLLRPKTAHTDCSRPDIGMQEVNKSKTLARRVPKYHGRDRSGFPSWKPKLRVHLTFRSLSICCILQSRGCPNAPGDVDTVEDSADITQTTELWKIDNNYCTSTLLYSP